MNTKLKMTIVGLSVVLLSACGQQAVTNESSQTDGSDQQQTQDQPQGEAKITGMPNDQKGGGRPQIDYAAVAKKLGVTEAALKSALGVSGEISVTPGQPGQKMDLDAAAKKLGVTTTALQEALGIGNGPQGRMQGGQGSGPANSD